MWNCQEKKCTFLTISISIAKFSSQKFYHYIIFFSKLHWERLGVYPIIHYSYSSLKDGLSVYWTLFFCVSESTVIQDVLKMEINTMWTILILQYLQTGENASFSLKMASFFSTGTTPTKERKRWVRMVAQRMRDR